MRSLRNTRTYLAILLLSGWWISGPAWADIQWVQLPLKGGETVRGAFGTVAGGKQPAVIFNHGTGVRHLGHDGAVAKDNMDVRDYVKALNGMGYNAIAPIRDHLGDTAYVARGSTVGSTDDWVSVVEYGVRVSTAAREFLSARAEVDPSRIAIMGFSEGGNVTLRSAIRQRNYRVVVLLSPASLRDAGEYSLRQAARRGNLSAIDVPVFLAVGEDDKRPIRKITQRRLIPNLQALGKTLVQRNDYPGGHDWFYRPRDALMKDVRRFLAEHLK